MTPSAISPITWLPAPHVPAPIRIPASYDIGPQRAPRTTPNIGLVLSHERDPLIVLATKAQSTHIHAGER